MLSLASADAVARMSQPAIELALFRWVLSYVESQYVEDVDQDERLYGAIKGMLDSAGPAQHVLRPEQYRELKNDTSGRFAGIGIGVDQRDGMLTAVSVIDGTPAARAGLLGRDQILRIDDQPTRGMMDYIQRCGSKRGIQVTLTVLRSGWKDPRNFVMLRDIIQIPQRRRLLA